MKTAERILAAFHRLRRDHSGLAAVEFALVSIPFFAIICAILETAYIDYAAETLQSATTRAARALLTGQEQGSMTTSAKQFVSNYLCPESGSLLPASFDCSKLIVDLRTATSYASADLSNDFYASGSNLFCPGAPGQVVVLRVAYPLSEIVPVDFFAPTQSVASNVPGLTGKFHIIEGSALFTEELFTGGYSAPAGC